MLVAFFSILCSSKTANANFTAPSGTIVRADTLTAYSGILTINGTLSLTRNTVLPGFTSVVINGRNGQIYWTNNSDLTFATATTIVIKDSAAGLRPGGGNSSQRLWVGNTLIAVANNNSGPAALTFTDINIAGGIPQFTLAVSAVSICYGSTITATLMPLNTMLTYDCSWSVNNAGGISPVAASNFNTPTTVSFTGAASTTSKEYTISCNVYKAGDRDIITTKTFNVTVNPTPSIPTVGSATPASVCFGYPSNINATSSGSTIEWFSVASGGTAGSKKNVLNNAVITSFNADKLKALNGKSELSVNLNPVISNTIDLLMNELSAGNYFIILYNSAGKILVNKMKNYVGGKNIQSVNSYQNLLNGTYQLRVIGPGKKSTTLKVMVQRK